MNESFMSPKNGEESKVTPKTIILIKKHRSEAADIKKKIV